MMRSLENPFHCVLPVAQVWGENVCSDYQIPIACAAH